MIQSKRHPLTTQPATPPVLAIQPGTGIPTPWIGSDVFKERVNNPSLDDVLILLEHPPVYTPDRQRLEFSNLTLTKQTGTSTEWSEAASNVPFLAH